MAAEQYPVAVDRQRGYDTVQDFDGVKPAPVLPVEPERPSVGRGDHECPVLGSVGVGLARGFDTGSVQRQDQRVAFRWVVVLGVEDRVVLA